MDDLTFRREAYENPNSRSPEFLAAIQESPSRRELVAELKHLDQKLASALKVELPEGLEAKLLLNQQLHSHQRRRKKTSIALALVASITLVVSLGYAWLRLAPVDLGQHALAHVYHEVKALKSEQDIDFNTINSQLASLDGVGNGHFSGQPGRILYSTYCDFHGVRSLHLVMQGAQGKVTVFIIPPESRMTLKHAFADNRYQGVGFELNSTYMLLVSQHNDDLEKIKDELKQFFI
ncbi:DUF3379 domain-containing protein [Shewanella sp. AS1]|uniref:DUF3379 domain-containing protein n=1 Tax=Shewanella sp. AS1 TaxID=2907626 RepID=UPI001F391011|nr:DUF3379 domain-containing protein [Shewanella sp. AS1]MCE9679527.1 DUF3379 domain-containing protein [Shewanella sp. AS1]